MQLYELIKRYAMPLYLQAISLLLPLNVKNVSVEDRCEGAFIPFFPVICTPV